MGRMPLVRSWMDRRLHDVVLPPRRRSGDEHHLHTLAAGDFIGDVSDFLFLQSFGNVDDIRSQTVIHRLVECADGAHAQNVLPTVVLLEDPNILSWRITSPNFDGSLVDGMRKSTPSIFFKSEEVQLAGVGEQRAVEIIHIPVYIIIGGIERAHGFGADSPWVRAQVVEHLDGVLGGTLVAG